MLLVHVARTSQACSFREAGLLLHATRAGPGPPGPHRRRPRSSCSTSTSRPMRGASARGSPTRPRARASWIWTSESATRPPRRSETTRICCRGPVGWLDLASALSSLLALFFHRLLPRRRWSPRGRRRLCRLKPASKLVGYELRPADDGGRRHRRVRVATSPDGQEKRERERTAP